MQIANDVLQNRPGCKVVLANRKRYAREDKCDVWRIPVYSSSASTFRDVRSHQSAQPGRTTQATNRMKEYEQVIS